MIEFSGCSMSGFGKSAGDEAPSAGQVHSLIIVARDQAELCHVLAREFASNPRVQVLLDRRHWERRRRIQVLELDRRGADRRHPTCPEHDVRQRSFVIIRRQDGTLED
jgi:hypothetical protein